MTNNRPPSLLAELGNLLIQFQLSQAKKKTDAPKVSEATDAPVSLAAKPEQTEDIPK